MKNRNVDVYLDDTPSNSGSIVKHNVETKHLGRPVHHYCLKLRTCRTGGPLAVIGSGMTSNEDKGEGEHGRVWTTREDGGPTLNPGLVPILFA